MKLRLISAVFAISLLPVAANAQLTIDMGVFDVTPISGNVAGNVG